MCKYLIVERNGLILTPRCSKTGEICPFAYRCQKQQTLKNTAYANTCKHVMEDSEEITDSE